MLVRDLIAALEAMPQELEVSLNCEYAVSHACVVNWFGNTTVDLRELPYEHKDFCGETTPHISHYYGKGRETVCLGFKPPGHVQISPPASPSGLL